MTAADDAAAPAETCCTCMCWRRYPLESIGDCRRHPPVVSEAMIRSRLMNSSPEFGDAAIEEQDLWGASNFPVTHEADWCADYIPQERPQ
ncbi:hypothetical protein ABC347_10830 [Sphingomonas sp. 1P06PA]|uniref:hypothetical protein n=1 Tax=Sphingomonas sp. 1P06PA TaxID=554121 RepID=UPI0039A5A177